VDGAGRLLRVSSADSPLETYSHDAAGNILTSARHQVISVDRGNRAVSAGDTSFTYDDDGQIEQRISGTEITRYEYDGNGCLIRVVLPQGEVVENTYDFLSRRLTKTVGGSTTRFFWDGEFLQGEQKDRGEPTFYITLPESPIPLGMIRDGQMHVLLFDQMGTVTEAFDEGGELSWASDYTAFYYLRQETAKVEQPIRALGQFHDRETGLYYNYFRHYDPLLGRYISADPAGYTYALNLYWYSSNACTWVDVDGQGLGSNGVLTLNWRCDWTANQKRDFLGKIKDQNNALKTAPATVSLPAPERPCGTAAKKWEKCKSEGNANSKRPVQNTGDPCKDNDADHRMELVLGGKDNCANMTPRNASVNRSVGSQIGRALSKAAKEGATSVTINKVIPSVNCKPPDSDSTPCKQNWSPNAAL
jgi:RHS repeat-associated protein